MQKSRTGSSVRWSNVCWIWSPWRYRRTAPGCWR